MDQLQFKKWLEHMDRLSSAPYGAGELQPSGNDNKYGRKGVRNKNTATDGPIDEPTITDPEELFGMGKKDCSKKKPNLINKQGI
jgi:hypothetical protein